MTAPLARTLQEGQARLRAGDWPAAAAAFSNAAAARPDVAAIRALLGVALLQQRRLPAAEQALRAALALDAGEPSALAHLALLLNATDRHAEAAALLAPHAASRPGDLFLQSQLADAVEALGHHRRTAEIRQHIASATQQPADWLRAAQAWMRVDAPRPAIQALRAVLKHEPNRTGVRARLGLLLLDHGLLDEAEAHFTRALALDPSGEHARVGLARLHLRRRDLAQAESILSPVLSGAPGPEALAVWAKICRRRAAPEAAIPHLEEAVTRETGPARSLLLHRLAELRDAAGDHDGAFTAWTASKNPESRRFNPAKHRQAIAALRTAYAPGRPLSQARNNDSLPIFIVGMPRSGTSLLEQMLDCHPLLAGVGEREEVRTIAANLSKRLSPGGAPYYLCLDQLSAELLDAHAEQHLETLRALAPGAQHAIDKMPHNFLHLGLIGQLFPNARILHCVRDPVDTCFSCFRQRFGAGLAYTARQDWLGHFYRDYATLMAHWQQAPPLPMRAVRYEALVQRPEETLRGVLSFIGVPWDDRCLTFHTSRRDVGTASHEQVQRPLYTSSIGRAAPYRRHLGPLLRALRGEPIH